MTKVLLFIWIGVGQSQTISMEKFDNLNDCLSARKAIIAEYPSSFGSRRKNNTRCVQYTVSQ